MLKSCHERHDGRCTAGTHLMSVEDSRKWKMYRGQSFPYIAPLGSAGAVLTCDARGQLDQLCNHLSDTPETVYVRTYMCICERRLDEEVRLHFNIDGTIPCLGFRTE